MAIGLAFGLTEFVRAGLGSLDSRAWLDGSAGAKVNTALALPWRSKLETADAAWRYRFLGQLGPQVKEGCPGWLFFTDGINPPVANPELVLKQRIELMHVLAKRLKAAGVQLLVVTVPDKSRVQNEALCGLARHKAMDDLLAQWQHALQAADVNHVDLTPTLDSKRDPFYRTDVHLNQEGAAAAAEAVAAAALPLLGARGNQHYTVESGGEPQARLGDLLILAGLEHAPAKWRPPSDTESPQIVRLTASGGLLDDGPAAKVMLAGSSNSRRSNFAERVGEALGEPILNVSRDGGKFADALMLALDDQAKWPKTVKLVIWEMSEMSLTQPLSDAEKAALQQLANAAS